MFFDNNEKPIPIQKKSDFKGNKSKASSIDFFNSFNINDRLLNIDAISTDISPEIDLNNHFKDVDNIIATTSIKLKKNKDDVINLSNQTLYQLNQFDLKCNLNK